MVTLKTLHFNNENVPVITGETVELADFSECEFTRINLSGATFISCNFYDKERNMGCSFHHGNIRETRFINCDLSLSSFSYADVFGAEFLNCRLIGADFENASFANLIAKNKFFCSGKIENCNLSNANLAGIIMEACILRENRWFETDITKAIFKGSDLSNGEFSGIRWTDADFTECDLRGSSLHGLDLRKVNLTGVKLDAWQISFLISELGIIIS
ncbi:pentapeptide repeat-containing protein [Pectobacteriaceae bacterium CE90]|nr:pentapeptide repeat-containing protein [Pectobacteriaceae bacterium CE90]